MIYIQKRINGAHTRTTATSADEKIHFGSSVCRVGSRFV